ncbi:VanZ family protein [Streptomyces sp. NPDC018031]|uniref:VanZ family protein n=1 Tax=Streptomyces sp. NPDC018031 TaxID=3365033 RepID=UPI0037B9DE17
MQGHGSGRRAAFLFRAAGFVLLAAHLAFVCWLTVRPITVPWVTPATFEPLASIRADLERDTWDGIRSIAGGLLLLAPMGILLPLAGGRLETNPFTSLARAVFAGAMTSLMVEVSHSWSTGQVVNIDGVLLNTAGVALAHLAVVPAVRARLRRRSEPRRPVPLPREEGAQPVTRTIPRVGIAP